MNRDSSNRSISITIVFNNARVCSGHCAFCTAANEVNYGQPNASSINDIKHINSTLNNLIKWDYDKLEKAIVSYPGFEDSKLVNFSVWGADPLTSFDQFCELYEFCHDIGKRHGKKVSFGGSTNGLAFMVPEWRDWFASKNDIHFQLSHDGIGNWIRTDIDTLKLSEPLMETGMINWISCVMNFYSCSPFKNIEYFKEHIPEKHYKSIQTRLYTVRDAYYDANALNKDGWFMGKQYDSLKGTPIGDMNIHNDEALAEKYGIFDMAHAADIYFDEIEQIYQRIDSPEYDPYRSVLIQRVAYNAKKERTPGDPFSYSRPWCAQYHLGQRDNSNCIDTLGKFTPCHLYDSDMPIPNPKLEKPARCNDCPYKDSWECNVCGSFFLNPSYCQWSYRFNQQMERLQKRPWIMDWVREYNRDRNLRDKRIHSNGNNGNTRRADKCCSAKNCSSDI